MKKNILSFTFFFTFTFCYAQYGGLDPSFGVQGIANTDMGSVLRSNTSARQVFTNPDGSIYVLLADPIISKRLPNGSIDSSYGINGYASTAALRESYAAQQTDGKILIVGSSSGYNITRLKTNGTRDSTFGNAGIQALGLLPTAVAVQNDGKVVVGGSAGDSFAVARFNANGSPDLSFHGTGQVITSLVSFVLIAHSLIIQGDGKVVLAGAGFSNTFNTFYFVIARYNIDGSLDNSFNGTGTQTTLIGGGALGYSLALQSDQKIVLGGYASEGVENLHFAVARYNTDGSLDNSFNGTGKVTAPVGSNGITGNSLALQGNGKIVVAGYTRNGGTNDFAVARFNINGTPDNSFDTDGILTTDISSSDDVAGSVAIQSDGKIIVAGQATSNGGYEAVLTRYIDNGSLDNSFGTGGKILGDYKQGSTIFNTTAIQADGKIVAAGRTWNGFNTDFALVRYNNNGSLDNTFSGDGKQTIDFGATADEAQTVAIQTDGKIVVAGSIGAQCGVARYNTDGTLDITFNGTGKLVTSVGSNFKLGSVALQSDGKIVLGGFAYAGATYPVFAVCRLNTNGTLDNTFSDDGKQFAEFDVFANLGTAMVIQPDGKILLAGGSQINNRRNFAIARFNNNGSLDTSFSHDGKQTSTFGPDDYFASSMALQNDGKIIVAGYSANSTGGNPVFAVARYLANGDLDYSFNDDGYQSTNLGAGFVYGLTVAINSNGEIAVGGTAGNYGAVVLYKNDGSRDSTFGTNGIQFTKIGLEQGRLQSLVFFENKLYAAGSALFPGESGVLVRYLLAPPLAGTEGILEAELAVLSQATVASNNAGFTGTGFADYTNNTGDYIEWTLNKTSPAQVSLNFRYANGGSFNRPLRLEINGVVVSPSLAFPSTGSWTTWAATQFTANLPAGSNKIRLTAIGSNGANVDHLAWRDTTIVPSQTSGILEAELAVLNQVAVASGNAGFTGTGYADYTNNTGDYIEWTLNKTSAGPTALSFRYALAGTFGRPLRLEVNGVVVTASLNFTATGSWTDWSTVQVTANLISGANKIRLTAIGSNGPNVDHLAWQNAAVTSGILEAELAVLSQATVASNYTGFTGTGFADYTNNTGDYVEWTLNKASTGQVNLNFRYALAGAYGRPLRLEVNGVVVAASLAFPPTGSWTTWATSNFKANLISGANKIRLTAMGSNGPNVDHLAWSDATSGRAALPGISLISIPVSKELSVAASPNPSITNFGLSLNSNNKKDKLSIIVTDLAGRVIEIRNNIVPGKKIELGSLYAAGTYVVKVLQGENYKVVKLVKARN